MALKQIVVLSDGVAGHDRSSEGIVSALERLGPAQTSWWAIKERRPQSRRLARFAAAHGPQAGQPERFATFLDGMPNQADVVVSTGPATAATNIALAKRLSARNIYYGFPKWPVVGINTLLSPLFHPSPAVALSPRPSNIDVEALPAPQPFDYAAPHALALLFGGDSKHYRYTEADLALLAERCQALLREAPKLSIMVFDSRRTKAAIFDAFAASLAHLSQITVHRFRDGGLGSNASAFHADTVLVTEDSMSMVSEAVAAGRPTLAIAPPQYRPPARDEQELSTMVKSGMLARVRFCDISIPMLSHLAAQPHQSGLAALAALLSKRGF